MPRLSKALFRKNMTRDRAGHGLSREGGEVEEKKLSSRKVSYGYHSETRKSNGYELGLFDGYSGNLFLQPDFWTDPKEAVKRAYKVIDDDILENVAGSKGGSTAVTAVLINREVLIVANVGESRAILCRDGAANQLSVDHDPVKEKELVESRGGCVVKPRGSVPRVDAQLAVSRAFGDGRVKEHITSEPDISIKNMDTEVDFIILASDGLWKVMSNQDECDCIWGVDDAHEAAEKLIQKALSRKSCDDISCIVVLFD